MTSRNQLTGLVVADGAHSFTLDLLSTDEARRLLVCRLGAERVAAEPEAVYSIIDACVRLPLALALIAARATAHPHFSLATLAKEFRQVHVDLDLFDHGDTAIDIRAAFSCSYQTLTPDAASLFRLLGRCHGPEIDAVTLASLAGKSPRRVRTPLAELVRANLVSEHAPGRYTLHGLLRALARELAQPLELVA